MPPAKVHNSFASWLKNRIGMSSWAGPFRMKTCRFEEKKTRSRFPTRLCWVCGEVWSLPGGLNAGQQISLLIDRETLAYSSVQSFDDLPIPFRCVATDLVSGKQAVFKDGSLSTAMRATMAIPGLFSPIREGEHVYVDGGLVGNLPTDVVRAMGADVVIGVHLQTSPAEAAKIESLFAILGRSIDVVVAGNEIRGLAGADLVVNVGLQDFGSLDYPKSKEIIEKGPKPQPRNRVCSRPMRWTMRPGRNTWSGGSPIG